MTKREIAELVLARVTTDELDAIIELLVARERNSNDPRANPLRDRDGFRALTPREFDEFLVEYGPQMQPPDGEG
jgi:hypothetical protein